MCCPQVRWREGAPQIVLHLRHGGDEHGVKQGANGLRRRLPGTHPE
jgi:hypothetical protein